MDREALRRGIAVKLAVSLSKHDKPGWGPDLGIVTDELLDGPLARLVDIAEKAEALVASVGDHGAAITSRSNDPKAAWLALMAAAGSPEGKP